MENVRLYELANVNDLAPIVSLGVYVGWVNGVGGISKTATAAMSRRYAVLKKNKKESVGTLTDSKGQQGTLADSKGQPRTGEISRGLQLAFWPCYSATS